MQPEEQGLALEAQGEVELQLPRLQRRLPAERRRSWTPPAEQEQQPVLQERCAPQAQRQELELQPGLQRGLQQPRAAPQARELLERVLHRPPLQLVLRPCQ